MAYRKYKKAKKSSEKAINTKQHTWISIWQTMHY
jgi:hypothetical protein